mgnify:CR=1 FL=1
MTIISYFHIVIFERIPNLRASDVDEFCRFDLYDKSDLTVDKVEGLLERGYRILSIHNLVFVKL